MKTFTITAFLCIAIMGNAQRLTHTLHFDSGKSTISANDRHWLDSAIIVLKGAATYIVDVKAYCDADGKDEANELLAADRGNAVKTVLETGGIIERKINVASFGEREPVANNATETGKAANRRVVVDISYFVKKANPVYVPAAAIEVDSTLSTSELSVGKKLVLKNLNFVGGTDELLPGSVPVLQDLLKLLNERPSLEVEIGGHVCCGPDMALSILRAKKVYDYLLENGIDKKRLSYKGYSFDKPVASERTEEGKTLNRRVEITVLKM